MVKNDLETMPPRGNLIFNGLDALRAKVPLK